MQNIEDMKNKTIKELARTCHTVDDVYEMLKISLKTLYRKYSKQKWMNNTWVILNIVQSVITQETAATVIAKKQLKQDLEILSLRFHETEKEISSQE